MIYKTTVVMEDVECPECEEEGVITPMGINGLVAVFFCSTCNRVFKVSPDTKANVGS